MDNYPFGKLDATDGQCVEAAMLARPMVSSGCF
jgi:hypothetical protein